tara:strand:- start:2043 stop:2291 length:249 start_codon:yes stop_codon:yes gene_type:complete
MELLKDIKDIIFNNGISEPVVMRSAGGWYIGRVYNEDHFYGVDPEDGFITPYDRLTEYMSKEDAIAFLDVEQPLEVTYYYSR